MTPLEKKQLLTLTDTLSNKIQIGLIESDHVKSRALKQFCDRLTQLVPKIIVKMEDGDGDEVPAIKIHSGLRYQADAESREVKKKPVSKKKAQAGKPKKTASEEAESKKSEKKDKPPAAKKSAKAKAEEKVEAKSDEASKSKPEKDDDAS